LRRHILREISSNPNAVQLSKNRSPFDRLRANGFSECPERSRRKGSCFDRLSTNGKISSVYTIMDRLISFEESVFNTAGDNKRLLKPRKGNEIIFSSPPRNRRQW